MDRTEAVIDRDLVFEFFLLFSRFEYALKRAGFVKGDDSKAQAHWPRFARSIDSKLTSATEQEFLEAVLILNLEPPKKQVMKCGQLGWAENVKESHETDAEWILRLVRTVRNNLFHGGKYPELVVEDYERNRNLLKACLVILKSTARMNPSVHQILQEPSSNS
jgi:hypothetical protein